MTTEHSNDPTPPSPSPQEAGIADPLIRITTALAVAAVAAVAAVISYRHAYELVTTHGETGLTARLLPPARRGGEPGVRRPSWVYHQSIDEAWVPLLIVTSRNVGQAETAPAADWCR